jgi:thiol-disulfide isomerase/thioredoxin
MRCCRWRAGLVALAILCIPLSAFAEDKVEVKVVKYPELGATIKKLKGKVVVVDFWADW